MLCFICSRSIYLTINLDISPHFFCFFLAPGALCRARTRLLALPLGLSGLALTGIIAPAVLHLPVPLIRQQDEPLLARLLLEVGVSLPRPQQRAGGQDLLGAGAPLVLLLSARPSATRTTLPVDQMYSGSPVSLLVYFQRTSSHLPTSDWSKAGLLTGCMFSTGSEMPASTRRCLAASALTRSSAVEKSAFPRIAAA